MNTPDIGAGPLTLLRIKLHRPQVSRELVHRPRLMERLNQGLNRKLTLVSAPAGYGKTTLVTEWLESVEHPVSWLALDENDNDPARFLAYFMAALQQVDPGIGQAAQAMLQAAQPPPPEALLTGLLNDVATTPNAFFLVLDDYHLIQTLPIHQQLAFWLEHQPPQMHLVLATREDPPLPLSRLRAGGQITDVRQTDLLFTAEETGDFLRRVMALDADTLHPLAEVELPGGPLIEIALDAARGRLYVLSALSPRYRGIFVLKTGDLSSLALVAGSPATPLTQAAALALSADGHLLVAESTRLYQISPEDFDVVTRARLEHPVKRGGLVADPVTGRAIWLSPAGVFVERGLVTP
jgi:hypothetical protein